MVLADRRAGGGVLGQAQLLEQAFLQGAEPALMTRPRASGEVALSDYRTAVSDWFFRAGRRASDMVRARSESATMCMCSNISQAWP